MDITREEFEKLVKEVVSTLPYKFSSKIENLEFIVSDYPDVDMLKKQGIYGIGTLLGLYEGVPIAKRGPGYQAILPDRITIFMFPIIDYCNVSGEDLKEKVRKVVLHEIGHFFGLSETELRDLGIA
ncbi:MAG: metallopeptidase family protein [Caldisericaceae bacterium]